MKKLLSLLFAVALITPSSAFANFFDVNDQTSYQSSIQWMADNGVINGHPDGSFRPDDCVNRAEMLKMLFVAAQVDLSSSTTNPFPDVDPAQWYFSFVVTALENGTVVGYPDGNFRPANCVNRVEALKMALKVFNIETNQTIIGAAWKDIDENQWYSKYFSIADDKNFLPFNHVVDYHYEPASSMSRKEVAELLFRIKAVVDTASLRYSEGLTPDSLTAPATPEPGPETTENFEAVVTVYDRAGAPVEDAKVSLTMQIKSNDKTYRYLAEANSTNSSGKHTITMSDIQTYADKFNFQPPYSIFLKVGKEDYLTEWIYDFDESPKVLNNEPWNVEVTLKEIPAREVITDGRYEVHYYPGEENCANIAMDKMKEFYPQVEGLLGVTPPSDKTIFTYNTPEQQGYGDWLGGHQGIWGVCQPWTDNTADPQIETMWNSAISHELAHHFVSANGIPYWSNEGLAQYVKFKLLNIDNDCSNPDDFLPVQDLTGENIPYYNTAACFWELLEEDNPGFIQGVIQSAKNTSLQSEAAFFDLIESIYGSDLHDFMVDNFHYEFSQ